MFNVEVPVSEHTKPEIGDAKMKENNNLEENEKRGDMDIKIAYEIVECLNRLKF